MIEASGIPCLIPARQFFKLKVATVTQPTKLKRSRKTVQPYPCNKKQKLQWTTDLTEKTYNNSNYCWSHGYNKSKPHMSDTCTRMDVGHKK